MSEFYPRDLRPELDERTGDLTICPEGCEGDLVYPTSWEEVEIDGEILEGFVVVCRCPNCEWRGVGFHDDETVGKFDYQLDIATEEIESDIRLLTRNNMELYSERFKEALDRDQIWPDDIGPPPLNGQARPPHGSYLTALAGIEMNLPVSHET